jgi:hydroxypyruvate isomerase
MTKNNLRFCANLSMLFTELPLAQRFGAAKQAGFSAVEIQFPYEMEPDELIALEQQHALPIVLINVDAGDLLTGGEGLAAVPDKHARFDEALTQCLHYAQQLKVECVNILAGRCLQPAQEQLYLRTLKGNLKNAADYLNNVHVKCVFEAINTIDMPHFLIHDPEQMMCIIDELKHSNLFMQYDIYHMTQMGRDVCADIKQYAPYIGHIQFADCPGRHEPGTGKIDFEKIFNAIKNSDYNGWIGAEYKPSQRTELTLHWLNHY